MKYRILIALGCVLLAAVVLLSLPPAHPAEPGPEHTLPSLTIPTHPTTAPEPAVVRLYCCQSQWLLALTELSTQYTQLTGTEVVILTPDADGCQSTLARLVESEEAPTVFCVHSEKQLSDWQDRLLDLAGTDLADQLLSQDLGVYRQENLVAFPMDLEAFGLLLNAELLATKAAVSRKDIVDLTSLATAVQILGDNSVKAFATNWDISDSLYLLSSGDPDSISDFLNLYLSNAADAETSQELFLAGEIPFYLGRTGDYADLEAAGSDAVQMRNLDILPTYTAQALQYFFRTAWCVNADVRQVDLEETMKFLQWMVTATDTGAPIDSLQTLTAFRDAGWYGNLLEKKVRSYMQSEPATLAFAPTPKNQTDLLNALEAYLAAPGDDTWNALKALLK